MILEIERRFRLNTLPPEDVLAAAGMVKIVQTYIKGTGDWIMRTRQTSSKTARPRYHLTMKRPVAGSVYANHEIEVEIDGITYLNLGIHHTQGASIEKTRWTIPHGDLTLEFDMFDHPALRHLMILEVELPDENHGVNMPDWFDGIEITGDRAYSNYALSKGIDEARRF
ncbi:inorganic triphosphatase [Brevundimonas phage vB_BpoS-Marchewka]|uniref:Inorganic triphosphatase n=1 Tax=Brevundimonas phage vB_BpoS-Marchewka TaxID=2948604 RepID=A0A9E7N4J4_9CAUD|nr:inorganic triphosphatase [Brevundimonas phage vB_BpoS-Marchewka]